MSRTRMAHPGRDVAEDLEEYKEQLEIEIAALEKKLARIKTSKTEKVD